jgi:ankyrin repeat protein
MELLNEKGKPFFEDYDSAYEMFLAAIEYGNVEVMSYLHDKKYIGVNVDNNDPDLYYMSPLDYAAENGQYEAAKYLLERGAVLTVASDESIDDTLRFASQAPNGEDMVRLICNLAESGVTRESYFAGMCGAVESGNNEALRYLLDRAEQDGYSLETDALIVACDKDFDMDNSGTEAVRILVEHGANVDGANDEEGPDYAAPLCDASMHGNVETVEYLISQGADVNAYSSYLHRYPLLAAANYGYIDIVKMLVENGATEDDVEVYRDMGSRRIYDYLKSAADHSGGVNESEPEF